MGRLGMKEKADSISLVGGPRLIIPVCICLALFFSLHPRIYVLI